MGIYDTKIYELKKKIDEMYSQIYSLEKNVRELNELSDKCTVVNRKVSDAISNLFANIDVKGRDIPGNFFNYYRNQIEQIVKNNNLYNFTSEVSHEQFVIKEKIIADEEEIKNLYVCINSLENELSYYTLNNVENSWTELLLCIIKKLILI